MPVERHAVRSRLPAMVQRFQPPVFAGNELVAVRRDPARGGFAVWRGERRVLTIPRERVLMGSELKRLAAWDGRWGEGGW